MHTLRLAILVGWILFWIYWLISAAGVKKRTPELRPIRVVGLSPLVVVVLLWVFGRSHLLIRSPILGAIGTILFVAGIAFAIWSRVILGRNWGGPMTRKLEPELITAGPYRFVRHPIYSGLLVATLGTALATSLLGLILVAVVAVYFYWAAHVEENDLTAAFPVDYPAYRAQTKMLLPFLL